MFRGQDLDDERQMDFARQFGELEIPRSGRADVKRRLRPEMSDISNLDEQGRARGRLPGPALPAAARGLVVGDEHDPLGRTLPRQRERVGVGGAGLVHPADVGEARAGQRSSGEVTGHGE